MMAVAEIAKDEYYCGSRPRTQTEPECIAQNAAACPRATREISFAGIVIFDSTVTLTHQNEKPN